MLRAKRREQTDQQKFPEPRLGLPEDPRPFFGSQHFRAAAALQQMLTARCLVAVVGPVGAGKSTVCHRAANSRWARQWFLQDEAGHPVHRRFWVDLEDCGSGLQTREKVAAALGRSTFQEALARLGDGKPCLLILDNADGAFAADGQGCPAADRNLPVDSTLAELAACVSRGASLIMTLGSVAGLDPGRPWTDVIEVPGFESHDEARQLFDHFAPRHDSDPRTDEVVAACDRVPLAIALVAKVTAEAALEAARMPTGSGAGRGLEFAREVVAATVRPDDDQVWAALSQFPSGLDRDDIDFVVTALRCAIRLHRLGVVRRCEAGVRVPLALRVLPPGPDGAVDSAGSAVELTDEALAELWRRYVRRAQSVVEPAGPRPAGSGGVRARGEGASPRQADRTSADAWLTRQVATLGRLVERRPFPDGALQLATAGLRVHESGIEADALDLILVRLLEDSIRLIHRTPPPGIAELAADLEDERRFGTAEALSTVLVEAHRRSGDTGAEAAALSQLGRTERLHGRYDEAIGHLLAAEALSSDLGDEVGVGSALFELGQVELDQGRLDDAETHLGQAMSLFAANGRSVGEANTNLELVRIDLARGHLDQAEKRLSDVIDRYDAGGHKLGSANACLQLGQLELARGHLDGAEGRFRAALDGYEQAADRVGFAHACLQLGQVDLGRGRLDSAERFFSGALAGYERVGDQVGRANAALQLGQIDLARGALESAAIRLEAARAAYEQLGDRIGVANASLQLGQVRLARGELIEAHELLDAAQSAYHGIGDRMGSANSRHIEGMLLQAQGQPSAAIATFADAARLYASLGRLASAGWSMAGAARACSARAERAGYAGDAVRLLEEAGLAEAAAQLAVELAAPPAPPPPPPASATASAPEAARAEPTELVIATPLGREPLASAPLATEPMVGAAEPNEPVAEAPVAPTPPEPLGTPGPPSERSLWPRGHSDSGMEDLGMVAGAVLAGRPMTPRSEVAPEATVAPSEPVLEIAGPATEKQASAAAAVPPQDPLATSPLPDNDEDAAPPFVAPAGEEASRKSRFRLGRKEVRSADPEPPTLPGF